MSSGARRARSSLFQGSQQLRSCIIAREVSGYRTRFEAIEKRLDDVEREHHEVGMERDPPKPR